MQKINVIGAGLAGCEAAYQIAKRGLKVNLFEQKPKNFSPAHKSSNFCELVCSNSLKNTDVLTSSGMLKEELKLFDSLVLSCAYETKVPAGNALAVDRDLFSGLVTKRIKENINIKIITQEITKINEDEITIIATGPLTSDGLISELKKFTGNGLYFFDAAAPIISGDSIDYNKTFNMSRYNKGEGEYVNCPLDRREYEKFYFELTNAGCAHLHDFEDDLVFEGCMPVEIMAKRGIDTLRFGPLKPAGLYDEKNNVKPYAVLQLRRENLTGTYYNLVGFQTNLLYQEQKRVFSLIPALKNAEFIKYGVMHKNTYINSPKCLDNFFRLKEYPNIFIAGQICGVEGYLESCASGLMCGINAGNMALNKELINLSDDTMIGAMSNYISNPANVNFQPINSNYAILRSLEKDYKNKDEKKWAYLERSVLVIKEALKIN